MAVIVLVRPGSTDFDEQQRIQGALNIPLSHHGEDQVRQTIVELRSLKFDLIYSSPNDPARGSAFLIGRALGVPVKILDGLVNVNHGLWQGLQVEEVRRKHPRVYKLWQEDPESICPPEGETLREAENRVHKCLDRLLKRTLDCMIVVPDPLSGVVSRIVRGRTDNDLVRVAVRPRWEVLRGHDQVPKSLSDKALGFPVTGHPAAVGGSSLVEEAQHEYRRESR